MSFGCEAVLDRLSPYLDSELSAPEAAAVRGHLSGCAACTVAHARLRTLESLSARLLAAPAIAAEEWARRWPRVEGKAGSARILKIRKRRERGLRTSVLAYAAAAAVLVAATLALPLFLGEDAGRYLCFSNAPGANVTDLIEVDHDVERYTVDVEVPSEDSGDAVVILISKL